MLAKFVHDYALELRADFQQFYGIDLRCITARRAADLAVMLPRESRVMRALEPMNEWTIEHRLLSLVEYWLHILVWRDTKDAKSKRNVPKQIVPQAEVKKKAEFAAPVDRYAALIAKPRKEVSHGD